MQKQQLVEMMIQLFQSALNEQNVEMEELADTEPLKASATLPLVGDNAAITSMGLVSLIADVESMLEDSHNISVTLVSEQALSRQHSPFRSIDALADYILELTGAPLAFALETV